MQTRITAAKSEPRRRKALPAQTKHAVIARDQARCTFTDLAGNRCTSDRWLHILTNILGSTSIAIIDPTSGCRVGSLSLIDLIESSPELESPDGAVCSKKKCSDWDFVANGIAFDKDRNELYVTGKNWDKIFVFENPIK